MRVKSKVKIQGRKVHVHVPSPGAKHSRQGGFNNNTNSLRVIYSSYVPSLGTRGSLHLGRGGTGDGEMGRQDGSSSSPGDHFQAMIGAISPRTTNREILWWLWWWRWW